MATKQDSKSNVKNTAQDSKSNTTTSSGLDIKPLTDADIEEQRKRLAKADPKILTEIFNTCYQTINSLLVIARKRTKDEDDIVEIERLKRIVNLVPVEELFLRSKDKIWAAREHICDKNAKWFLDRDYSNIIKRDHNQVFIETIVSLIKDQFDKTSKEDMDKYWEKAIILLRNVGRYKQLIGEA